LITRVEDIIGSLHTYHPDADENLIWKAYTFSAKVHKGQTRLSGEPYLSHPMHVAFLLTKMKMDDVSVAVGMLHDTIEDTYATPDEVKQQFGDQVFSLVDGVTKISQIHFSSKEEQQAENFRKMILAMSKDIRVIMIKLADRLHNMRTLRHMSPEKQKTISEETLDIYAPIANRLGISWVRTELENLSFQYRYPEDYTQIKNWVRDRDEDRKEYLDKVLKIVKEALNKAGLKVEANCRSKHYYSIFKKMNDQKINFNQVYDIQGIRIITQSLQDCYTALGIIHSIWVPIPGKIKDYIAMPKSNLYQSLHTTVLGPEGKRVEFQIRTQKMHEISEEGIAAHWRYKEPSVKKKDDQFVWLRRLVEWQQDVKNPREFLENIKVNLFPDDVYVFTPKGEVLSFPRGATPIDYAYQIHTYIGNHCIGAKVNDRIVPLKYQIKNGDIIEILSSQNQRPNQDWLKFVKTSKARSKIRSFIRNQQREWSLALGRQILEREISHYHNNPGSLLTDTKLDEVAPHVGLNSADGLISAVGFGKLSVQSVLPKLLPKEFSKDQKLHSKSKPLKVVSKTPGKIPSGIRVSGSDNIMVQLAKCCNPVQGDEITGFISRGRGVIVHTADCENLRIIENEPERMVEVEWDTEELATHNVQIRMETLDHPGILANISQAVASCRSNIVNANITTTDHGKGKISFTINIKDLNHLQTIIKTVESLDGVIQVERIKEKPSSRKQLSFSKKLGETG